MLWFVSHLLQQRLRFSRHRKVSFFCNFLFIYFVATKENVGLFGLLWRLPSYHFPERYNTTFKVKETHNSPWNCQNVENDWRWVIHYIYPPAWAYLGRAKSVYNHIDDEVREETEKLSSLKFKNNSYFQRTKLDVLELFSVVTNIFVW